MVELTNLGQINDLYGESRDINLALDYLATGGRIAQMMITPPIETAPAEPPGVGFARPAATVATGAMQYPQAMVDAIRGELEKRLHEINDQLAGLGVTGVPGR